MKKKLMTGVIASMFCYMLSAQAVLSLQLTRGLNRAVPIAVVPFKGWVPSAVGTNNLATIIQNDLHYSGRFNVLASDKMPGQPSRVSEVNLPAWRALAMQDLVVGQVKPLSDGRYRVSFSLIGLYLGGSSSTNTPSPNQVLASQSFTVKRSRLRFIAHRISNIVYQQLTGVQGVFTTKIAYVETNPTAGGKTRHRLLVADADGFAPKLILGSNEPIMSPAWSPDGRELAYVSFERGRSQIYVSNVATGSRRVITNFRGINGAPAWSPNGRRLAVVLSKSGSPKIYLVNLATRHLTQLTYGASIDTEPSFTPDGRSLVFTSDRGGSPQVYQVSIGNKQVSRLTFDGSYNASPSVTQNGKALIFLHRNEQGYNIAMMNLTTGQLTLLTNQGHDESPSVAPNGNLVLYATKQAGRGVLQVVSTNQGVSYRLPATDGNVQEPAWSPYFS